MIQEKSLTSGNISFQLIQLALPLMLGNILQQLYNTIDALVIGHFAGQEQFAAIGVAGSISNLFLFAIVGACTGIGILFAQHYGRNDMDAFRREHFTALLAGLSFALLTGLSGILFLPGLLHLIQTPASISGYVTRYVVVLLIGLPLSMLYNLYSSILRSIGDTKTALVILLLSILANTALDVLLVAVFHLEILGAALATVMAQALSSLFCILYLYKAYPQLWLRRECCHLEWHRFVQTFHFGGVTALHQSGLYIGKLLVQGAVNTGGLDSITAYTATTRIEGFANSFGDSGATATSVMAAQNYGAKKQQRVNSVFWKSLLLLFLLGILCSFIMYTGSSAFIRILTGTSSGSVFDNAQSYLRTIAFFYPFCFTGNTFAGYFDGCGKVSIPFIGAISHIFLRVILSWLFISRYGLTAVAVATGIGWVLVNLFWGLYKHCHFDKVIFSSSQATGQN